MTDRSPNDTLLLDVMQAVGKIAGQNELILAEQGLAARDRKDLQSAMEKVRLDAERIRDDVSIVKGNVATVTERVTTLEPDVKKMKAFRAQVALSVFFVTATVTGAINLIWIALSNLSGIREALREFLR
jgi:hypothetical protein